MEKAVGFDPLARNERRRVPKPATPSVGFGTRPVDPIVSCTTSLPPPTVTPR